MYFQHTEEVGITCGSGASLFGFLAFLGFFATLSPQKTRAGQRVAFAASLDPVKRSRLRVELLAGVQPQWPMLWGSRCSHPIIRSQRA